MVIQHPPGHGHSLGCLAPRSSAPFHPFCVLLAARHPSGHSALAGYSAPSRPGYSVPFRALLVTRRFPVCSSPLHCRYPQWPSWLLLALVTARRHPSGYHVFGAIPHCMALSWPLAAMLTSLHPHGCSTPYRPIGMLIGTGQSRVCLANRRPPSTRCPLGAL